MVLSVVLLISSAGGASSARQVVIWSRNAGASWAATAPLRAPGAAGTASFCPPHIGYSLGAGPATGVLAALLVAGPATGAALAAGGVVGGSAGLASGSFWQPAAKTIMIIANPL